MKTRFSARLFGAVALLSCGIVICVRSNEQENSHLRTIPCDDVSDCARQGRQALQNDRPDAAIPFFEMEAGDAEEARDEAAAAEAYNNLALAHLALNQYAKALAWTRMELRLNPKDARAERALGILRTHMGALSAGVTGVYLQYAGRAMWNSFCVRETHDHWLEFRLLTYRPGLAWRTYGPAAYGDLSGQAHYSRASATYSGDKDFPTCRLVMKFASDTLTLRQDGDCGFGYGVQASGNYERFSSTQADLQCCGQQDWP